MRDAEGVGDQVVVGPRFDDVRARGTEDPVLHLLVSLAAQDEFGEILGKDRLLKEVAATHQLECLAASDAVDDLVITAVKR